MMYLGDFPANGKVSFLWNTNGQDGAAITRSTDGTLKIFKSHATAATWATERSSLAGVTQLEDFDATGIHSVYIDLSDNTDAGFYAAGNEYQVAIVGATVDTKTVNTVLAHFSIARAGGVLATVLAGVTLAADQAVNTTKINGTAQTAGNLTAAIASLPQDKTGYTIAAGGIPVGAFSAGAITDAAMAADAEAAIAAAVLAGVVEAQGSYTVKQALSICLAVLAGVTSGGGATIKTPNGVATRVTAVVNGSNERTSITVTP